MKKALSFAELDSQTAMALPDREMMLVTIVVTNVLNNLTIDINVANNRVAAQVCLALLATGVFSSCEIQQP